MGAWSPIPRFWSHSLTFNIIFQGKQHQNSVQRQADKLVKQVLIVKSLNTNLFLLLVNFFDKSTFLQCKMQIKYLRCFLHKLPLELLHNKKKTLKSENQVCLHWKKHPFYYSYAFDTCQPYHIDLTIQKSISLNVVIVIIIQRKQKVSPNEYSFYFDLILIIFELCNNIIERDLPACIGTQWCKTIARGWYRWHQGETRKRSQL